MYFNLEKAVDQGVKRRKTSSPALPPEGEGSKTLFFWERERDRVRVKPDIVCLK